jgi:HEAT repeat protein/LysM domain-containing protein
MTETRLTDNGSWIVSQGDTLSYIAQELGVTVSDLEVFHTGPSVRQFENHKNRPDLIHRGDIVSVKRTTVFRNPFDGGAGESVDALVHTLITDPGLRVHAAETLGDMGEKAAGAVPALTQALRDPSRFVRDTAASALAKIARTSASSRVPEALAAAIPALVEIIITKEGSDVIAAQALCSIIEGMGERGRAALPILENLWNWDVKGAIRGEIAETLQRLGSTLETASRELH